MDCTTYRVKDYQESRTFRIEGYSLLKKDISQVEVLPEFVQSGVKWQLKIFLGGSNANCSNSWSVYVLNKETEPMVADGSVSLMDPSDSKKSVVVHTFNKQKFRPNFKVGWDNFIDRYDALDYIVDDSFILKVSMTPFNYEDPTCNDRFDIVSTLKSSAFSANCVAQSVAKLATDAASKDTTLVVQQAVLHAHRTILMARSPVFHAMFSAHMQENEIGEVHIPDFEAPVVRELLHFMYTDCLTQDATVPRTDLLCIATKYQVQGMMFLCENLLIPQINEDSAAPLLQLADQQGAAGLKRACLRFVAHNADKVTGKRAFHELDQELKDAALLVTDVLHSV